MMVDGCDGAAEVKHTTHFSAVAAAAVVCLCVSIACHICRPAVCIALHAVRLLGPTPIPYRSWSVRPWYRER